MSLLLEAFSHNQIVLELVFVAHIAVYLTCINIPLIPDTDLSSIFSISLAICERYFIVSFDESAA